MPKSLKKAISFVGTLVVLVGALAAASIVGVIIVSLSNALSTQPYVVAGEAYYVNATNFTHFHIVFYNTGRGGAVFEYMYIYAPTNISGRVKVTVVKVFSNGTVINNTTGAVIGSAVFKPYPPATRPQGGGLDAVVMVNNLNVNVSTPNTYMKVMGVAVFDRDSTTITFEQSVSR